MGHLLPKSSHEIYHRVWKVHTTHIMLNRRTTIMAFIECTDLHVTTKRYHGSRKLFMPLEKQILNQGYSNNPPTVSIVSLSRLKFLPRRNFFNFEDR